MRVLKESYKGVAVGATIPLGEPGLPARPERGLLIVFWKGL